MSLSKRLTTVFWLALITFIISGVSGLFFDFHYYPIARKMLREIHIWDSYLLLILMIIHVIDNWNWVKNLAGKYYSLASKNRRMVITFWIITISFIIVNLTGISLHLKYIVLPHGWTKRIHDYVSYVFIIFTFIHLADNYKWIKKVFK